MRRLSAFILAAVIAVPAAASDAKVGTSGAQFLRVGAGARPTAMGEAYTAVSGDVYSAYYNPAGLAAMERPELTAMHTQWFQGIDYAYGAFAFPATTGTFAVSAATLQTDEIDKRGTDEAKLGTFKNLDAAYALSYGTAISEALSFGLTARFLQQEIDSASASAWSGDAGAMYAHPDSRFSYGLAIRHFGQEIKFDEEGDPQPMVVDAGTSGRFLDRRLTLAANVLSPRDNDLQYGVGAEWAGPADARVRYAGRAGFRTAGTDADGASGLSLGFGLGFRRLNFDVAWVPFGDLGNTFRYAILVKF